MKPMIYKIRKIELFLIALCLGLALIILIISIKYNGLISDYNALQMMLDAERSACTGNILLR